MKNAKPQFLTSLRLGIIHCFDINELRNLCTDLGIDYENLIGEGKEAKARELIAYLYRRGRLPEFLRYCITVRPDYGWPKEEDSELLPILDFTQDIESIKTGKVVQQIFNYGELAMGDTFNLSGDFRNSILNIRSTLEKVHQGIGTIPNADTSLKDKLRELVDQLNEELQSVSTEKSEEAKAIAEYTKQLVDSVNTAKPNKAMVQVSAEGLKQAAENLAVVTPLVVRIATQIVDTIMQILG